MEFEIVSAQDLLPLNTSRNKPIAISSLTNAELKKYEAAAEKFVKDFQSAYPEGKTVKLIIESINMMPNEDGRVIVVLAPNPDFNSRTKSFPVVVLNGIARSAGLPDYVTLASVIATTKQQPSYFETTVKAVSKGDEYTRADGTVSKFKQHTMFEQGQETLVLSAAAQHYVASLNHQADLESVMAARRAAIAGFTNKAVPTAVPANDDADVIGG